MNNSEIYHWGIKGMKWGRRKNKGTEKLYKEKTVETHDDYARAHSKKSVQSMSDAELRSRNNRLQMERQYSDLTKKTNIGKKIVTGLIATAGTLAAAERAYSTYKHLGDKAYNGIANKIMKSINLGGKLTN